MRFKVEGREYHFDGSKLLVTEAVAIKKATGMPPIEWLDACDQADPLAFQALVWLCRHREGETSLRFEDVEFDLMTVEYLDEPADPTKAAPRAAATSTAGSSPTTSRSGSRSTKSRSRSGSGSGRGSSGS